MHFSVLCFAVKKSILITELNIIDSQFSIQSLQYELQFIDCCIVVGFDNFILQRSKKSTVRSLETVLIEPLDDRGFISIINHHQQQVPHHWPVIISYLGVLLEPSHSLSKIKSIEKLLKVFDGFSEIKYITLFSCFFDFWFRSSSMLKQTHKLSLNKQLHSSSMV